MKRVWSLLLSLVMFLSAPLLVHAEDNSIKNGDIIKFGNYPQSLVTDSKLIKKLDTAAKKWESYEYVYYEKTGDSYFDNELNATVNYTERTPSDRMQYSDFTFENQKYRAVSWLRGGTILDSTMHWPNEQRFPEVNEPSYHGVYYFLYEPIEWVVMDAENGLVVSLYSLDQQEFNDSGYYYDEAAKAYYMENTGTYLNDYSCSSIRQWLNESFMNTAFNKSQIELIDRNNYDLDEYDYHLDQFLGLDSSVNDLVTIPSFNEFKNQVNYSIVSTDYAAFQGHNFENIATRSVLPGTAFSKGLEFIDTHAEIEKRVPHYGSSSNAWSVSNIVPMMKISSLKDNTEIAQADQASVCKCACHNLIHSNNVIGKFIFRMLEAIWELFSVKQYCNCGLRHY